MSAPAIPQVKLTRGFAQIPNSLIENQVIFTRAELALLLCVLKLGGNDHGPVPVSDRTWQAWTGFDPRSKNFAVNGLRKKCLSVEGRGETARYAFARDNWETFARSINRNGYKARTAGRAVDPKPGAKIHPECRERGCSMIRSQQTSPESGQLITLVASTPNRKPVSESDLQRDNNPLQDNNPLIESSPLASTPNRKPVSESVTDLWAKTLAALQTWLSGRFGPGAMIQAAFLARLVAVVCGLFGDLSDPELAEAVEFAFVHRKGELSTESLLTAIPDAIRALRSGRRRPPRDNPGETPPTDASPPTKPFEQIMGVFLSLGVAVSGEDLKRCRATWNKLDAANRQAALKHALGEHAEWDRRAEQYVPRPWNYLANRQWRRKAVAPGREQNEGRGEKMMREADAEYDRRKKAGTL